MRGFSPAVWWRSSNSVTRTLFLSISHFLTLDCLSSMVSLIAAAFSFTTLCLFFSGSCKADLIHSDGTDIDHMLTSEPLPWCREILCTGWLSLDHWLPLGPVEPSGVQWIERHFIYQMKIKVIRTHHGNWKGNDKCLPKCIVFQSMYFSCLLK